MTTKKTKSKKVSKALIGRSAYKNICNNYSVLIDEYEATKEFLDSFSSDSFIVAEIDGVNICFASMNDAGTSFITNTLIKETIESRNKELVEYFKDIGVDLTKD